MKTEIEKLFMQARQIVEAHAAERKIRQLARHRGLSASLLYKIVHGERILTYKTAAILVDGTFKHSVMEERMSPTVTIIN